MTMEHGVWLEKLDKVLHGYTAMVRRFWDAYA